MLRFSLRGSLILLPPIVTAVFLAACGSDGGGGGGSGGGQPNSGTGGTGGVAAQGGAPAAGTGSGQGGANGGSGGTGGSSAGSGGSGLAGAGGSGMAGSGATGGAGGGSGQAGSAGMAGGGAAGGAGGTSGAGGSGGAAAGAGGALAGAGGMSGSGAGSGGSGGGSQCTNSTLMKGDSTRMLNVGGTMRSYLLHVPSKYDGTTPLPLVLDFHGIGGSGSQQKGMSGFAALSDSEGFVIAWPNGIDQAWNVGPCCTKSRSVDDLGFAKGMVKDISDIGCIDLKRVYANGFSMGGGMSHYLACNAADVFAAVTPSAFDLLEESEEPCNPSRPISELTFRGTSDTVVPYDGGPSTPPNGCCSTIHFLGAVGTFKRWAMVDGCTGDPTTDGSQQMYMSCMAGVQVGLYTIQGGSHAPGPADKAWAFLKTKTLP